MQFEYASKTENLLSRIPCSGYFFIKNVTHNKALVFSFLSDEIGWSTIGWSTIGYYILSLFNYCEFILQTAVLFAICNIIIIAIIIIKIIIYIYI